MFTVFHDPRVIRYRQICDKFLSREVWNRDIHIYQGVEVWSPELTRAIVVKLMPFACRANDYSGNDKGAVTPWKALLLTNVAAGREYVMRQNDTTLKAPPQGYNSVSAPVLRFLQ